MDHTQNKQNIRRPVPNRNDQAKNVRRPAQPKTRTSFPSHHPPELMIHRQQIGGKPPTSKRNPVLRNTIAVKPVPVPHKANPGTTRRQSRPDKGHGTATRQRRPTGSRNFILATIFAALILMTIIIGAVQSCAADKNTNGAVTTAPPRIVNNAENGGNPAQDESSFPAFATYTEETEDLVIDSEYGILIDLETNTVIASKNGESKIYPASMTKIMTLIVAVEHLDDLDATYTFPAEIFDPLYQENASVAGFEPGETVPYRDLLYGTALPSGADATTGLALSVAGSETAFATMMNETARRLGLENTHFVNASGLHDDAHYTTCHEMALILEYAISIPELRQVLGTYQYITTATAQHPEGIELRNTLYSRMVGDEAQGMYVQGGKTGYTQEARHCLATFAAPCTEENAPFTRPRFILVTAYAWSEYKPVYDAINTYTRYKP